MMVFPTCDIFVFASVQCLVRSAIIFAIVDTIADQTVGNAAEVFTGEFAVGAVLVIAIEFIRAIPTIIFVITLPGAEDASAIGASKLGGLAGVCGTVFSIFVTVVSAVVIPITRP